MQNMSSARKTLFLCILFLLQKSNASSSKLLSNNLLQSVGRFLESDSAQKMRETSKQWSNVKIYENIFPTESEAAVFRVAVLRNVNTEEIIWVPVGEKMPNQEELVSYLRRNNSAKWNDVFLWFNENRHELIDKQSTNKLFLKTLVLAIAENVAVKFMCRKWNDEYAYSPLMLAAVFDDKDSILALIKRGANVNQYHIGRKALHIAALYGNIDACATLLDNDADIDAVTSSEWTSLMYAAWCGKKNVYEFLKEKGADQTRTNNFGRTASQIADFQQR
jgi:hypothetical protein